MIRVFATVVVVACATYEDTFLLQRKVVPNKHLFFIHIPKCAGASFMADAQHIVSPTPVLNNLERCLADRILVMIRFWPLCCGVL